MSYKFLEQSLFTFEGVMESGLTKQGAASALRRLEEQGMIKKLRRGLYARINPLTGGIFASTFEIGTAMHPGSVIAYHTALEYYGLGHQAYSEAYCLCPARYGEETVEGVLYRFFGKTIEEGVAKRFGSTLIRVTDLERSVVDCLDRIDLCGGYEELCNCLSALDSLQGDKVLKYLGLYQKKNLYQKAGFVLSKLGIKGLGSSFFETCERNIGTAWVDLCATGERGDKDARWRVKAPNQFDYDYRESE